MEKLEMSYLKEKVGKQLKAGKVNRNRREDLYSLDQQISGLCSTFELISSEQEMELKKPVKEAMAQLGSSMTIKS